MRRLTRISVWLAAASSWLGCGGGSPSDVVEPQEVEVAVIPIDLAGPRSVTVSLAAASGRELSLDLVGQEIEGATGVVFDLDYDSTFLEFTGADPGSFFGPGAIVGAAMAQDDPGRIVGVAATLDQASGRSGSGTLLSLRFRLKELRDGATSLTFQIPQSLVYGREGSLDGHLFTGVRVVTRIRLPG